MTRTGTRISRRKFVAGAGAVGAVGAMAPRLAFGTPGNTGRGDVLVQVFLRGGMDGLSAIVPYEDGGYYALRPTIAVPPPNAANRLAGALPLASGFGMHPVMAPLYDGTWADNNMAVVVGTGMPPYESATRSHFDAQIHWEAGSATALDGRGWLARHLATNGVGAAVEGVGRGTSLQRSLRGDRSAFAVSSLGSFGLQNYHWSLRDEARDVLGGLYVDGSPSEFLQLGHDTLGAIDLIGAADGQPTEATYPGSTWQSAPFSETAKLIKAGIGLQAVCVDVGGWDMHSELGTVGDPDGRFHRVMGGLAGMLAAFYQDLGPTRMQEVTILVMSEFGRTINENGDGGCDHGRGSATMLIGGNVNGGLYGADTFPGVTDDPDHGDLGVAIDYRRVVGEVVRKRLDNPDLGTIFPTYVHDTGSELGIA